MAKTPAKKTAKAKTTTRKPRAKKVISTTTEDSHVELNKTMTRKDFPAFLRANIDANK